MGEEGGCHVKVRRQRGTMGRAAGLCYDGTGRRERRERDASRVLEEVASSTPRVSGRLRGWVSAKTGRVGEGVRVRRREGEREGRREGGGGRFIFATLFSLLRQY